MLLPVYNVPLYPEPCSGQSRLRAAVGGRADGISLFFLARGLVISVGAVSVRGLGFLLVE